MRLALIIAEVVFWGCGLLIVYAYLLYPIVLFVAWAVSQLRRDWCYLSRRRNRRSRFLTTIQLPPVTMVIAAYNEEAHLADKIANLRRIEYPKDKLEVVFVSDGSTDHTNDLLTSLKDTHTKVVLLPKRGGKPAALNQAVACARNAILVFSDAATLFAPDAVQKLVRHFADPAVGAVCGALQFRGTAESQQTEGVYWGYESKLRLMESRLGATLTASGAIYAMRRECYCELRPDVVIEDFVIPMNVRRLGYEVLYDPEAVATEVAASSVRGEFRRRVRLAIGSFRNLGNLIHVPLDNFTRVAFFSHKFLRWMVPFLLIGMLASNFALHDRSFYQIALAGQLLFYLWAVLGFTLRHRLQNVRYALVGYFLLAMNLAFLVGFFRFLFGRTEATWERAR